MPAFRTRSRLTVSGAGLLLSSLVVACTPFVTPHVPVTSGGGPKTVVAPKSTPKPTPKPTASPTSKATITTTTPPTADPVPAAALAFASNMIDGLTTLKSTESTVGLSDAAKALAGLPFLPTFDCPRCDAGPALASAAVYAVTKVASRKTFAINAIDTLLQSQTRTNGALAPADSTSPDIDTMFMAGNIGEATLLLGPNLDPAHIKSWTVAVTGAADYLVKNGNLRWYTNGNVVVGNALTMAIAYKLTGLVTYQTDYQQALSFAVSPPQTSWKGFGFITTKAPLKADGSDGRGYFTETGSNGPGYDPDYTMLQSEQLGRLYLITKDPAVLRLLNMETNQLLSSVDPTTGFMPGIGTRHSYPSEFFDSSAPAVLAYVGGRTDLMSRVSLQLTRTAQRFAYDLQQSPPLGDRDYYAIGLIPVTILASTSHLLG
jgi:hypothetical protein